MARLSGAEREGKFAFSCSSCLNPDDRCGMDYRWRCSMHCGWVSEDEWTAPGPPKVIDGLETGCNVCPGYLMAQPIVGEVVSAWRPFERGCLEDYWPDAPGVIWEGATALSAAVDKKQADDMREATKKKPELP